MCVCVCVCVCVYIIYIIVYTINIYVYIYIYICVCVCVCVYVRMYVCMLYVCILFLIIHPSNVPAPSIHSSDMFDSGTHVSRDTLETPKKRHARHCTTADEAV
jgi:hypothetical protein